MDDDTAAGQRADGAMNAGVSNEPDRAGLRVRPTRLERALEWANGLAPSPFRWATSCCGMAISQGGDLFEALGTAPPAVSARSADLLIVAGSLTRRQVPLLEAIHERMLAPRWVVAWGECAADGGPYQNYATVSGLSRIIPVDIIVRGCPPTPEAFREALESLRAGAGRGSLRPSSDDAGWPIRRPCEVNQDPMKRGTECR